MAYPHFYAGGRDSSSEIVPQQYETIVLRDGLPLAIDRGIVHFDLDIQNSKSILLRAFDRVAVTLKYR